MKVRLYRGPHDGKVVFLNDTERYLELAQTTGIDYTKALKDQNPLTAVGVVKTTYVRTKHTHPDNSVYFEWDQPKGTRTGIKPKRKPKRAIGGYINNPNIYISDTGPFNTAFATTTISTPYRINAP